MAGMPGMDGFADGVDGIEAGMAGIIGMDGIEAGFALGSSAGTGRLLSGLFPLASEAEPRG